MKRSSVLFLFACMLVFLTTACAASAKDTPTPTPVPATPTFTPVPPTPTPTTQDFVGRFHWFGFAAFLYQGSQTIYFDPVTLAGQLPPADLILVTHGHNDHWSVAEIKKIIGPNTTLVVSPNVAGIYEREKNTLGIPAIVLGEGETTEVNGVSIKAVPAFDDSGFHQRESGGMGFIVTVDGQRIYHAGGTYAYPEMASYECDIAILPFYRLEYARSMAEIIPGKVIIFMHTNYYGAKSVGDLFALEPSLSDKTFVALQNGPYEP